MRALLHYDAATAARQRAKIGGVLARSSVVLVALLAYVLLAISARVGRAQVQPAQGQGAFADNFASDGSLNAALWTTQSNLLKQVAAAGEGGNQCFSLSNSLIPPILSFGSGGMKMSGTTGWQQFTGIQSLRTFSPPFEFRTTVTVTVANGNPFEIFFVSTDGREWFSVYGNVNPANQPYVGIKLGCDVFYGQPALNVPYTIDMTASASGLFSVSLSSGSATLAKSTVQVGTGPFYLILGQGEGWPNTPGTKNAAFWQSVTVATGRIPATAPTVTLYAPITSGTTVSLNGVATPTTPGATITQLAWNWGDGSVQEIGSFPETHIYAESGNYNITVTATDSNGLTGSADVQASTLASTAPAITSVSPIYSTKLQNITITGSGFGSFASQGVPAGDSPYLEITDTTGNWSAGYKGSGAAVGDWVTVKVSKWTDTEIDVSGFGGLYGKPWWFKPGDSLNVMVCRAQTTEPPVGPCTTSQQMQVSSLVVVLVATPDTSSPLTGLTGPLKYVIAIRAQNTNGSPVRGISVGLRSSAGTFSSSGQSSTSLTTGSQGTADAELLANISVTQHANPAECHYDVTVSAGQCTSTTVRFSATVTATVLPSNVTAKATIDTSALLTTAPSGTTTTGKSAPIDVGIGYAPGSRPPNQSALLEASCSATNVASTTLGAAGCASTVASVACALAAPPTVGLALVVCSGVIGYAVSGGAVECVDLILAALGSQLRLPPSSPAGLLETGAQLACSALAPATVTVNVSPASVAPPGQFTVSGSVASAQGGPVENATVQILGSAGSNILPLTTVTTASNGTFSAVLNAPPVTGNVVITATVVGTSPPVTATATLTVTAAQ